MRHGFGGFEGRRDGRSSDRQDAILEGHTQADTRTRIGSVFGSDSGFCRDGHSADRPTHASPSPVTLYVSPRMDSGSVLITPVPYSRSP